MSQESIISLSFGVVCLTGLVVLILRGNKQSAHLESKIEILTQGIELKVNNLLTELSKLNDSIQALGQDIASKILEANESVDAQFKNTEKELELRLDKVSSEIVVSLKNINEQIRKEIRDSREGVNSEIRESKKVTNENIISVTKELQDIKTETKQLREYLDEAITI